MVQTLLSSVRISASYVVPKYNLPSTTYNPLTNTTCAFHAQPSPQQRRLSLGRRFSIRATTQVNSSGSIDSPLMLSMETKIKEQLNAEFVSVKDAYGDGRHVSIDVVSSSFEGQSAVNRQRMVYKAIWAELQSIVHAVDQMTTKTPAEAGIETQ